MKNCRIKIEELRDEKPGKSELKHRGFYHRYRLLLLLVVTAGLLFVPHHSHGFWPFTSKKDYLVKVGDKVITMDDFVEEVNKLHMSSRVGKALSEQHSFKKQDYRKFLDELIDQKLMVIEAENFELDKDPFFLRNYKNYSLNLFLQKLRQEEIFDKIKIDKKEIEEKYKELYKDKKLEEMTPQELESVRRTIFNEKVKEREEEYFARLRKKARIKINRDVLDAIPLDDSDFTDNVVAEVNGEPILASEVVELLKGVKKDERKDKKGEILDRLIIRKLLDLEAIGKNYQEVEKDIGRRIKRYRERLLIELFKAKVIMPSIKVEEDEVVEYYNKNRENFKEFDIVNVGIIFLESKKEAESVYNELKNGADFPYLARTRSLDTSTAKSGGNMGWVVLNRLPEGFQKVAYEAKEGEVYGPFPFMKGYAIFEFRGLRKGDYMPIEKVRKTILTKLYRERFEEFIKEYIEKLRETVSIDINEEELKRIEGS